METKELKINIPEGYEIDKNESIFEKIVFKKKDTKPRSWEELWKEYIAKVPKNLYKVWGVVESKELAEAFLAMMQLMSLRQSWVKNWKPDWNGNTPNYCITVKRNNFDVYVYYDYHCTLSFPTKEMAIDFMNCFKELLETAKPLI